MSLMVKAGGELDVAFPAMVGDKVEAVIVQPSLPLTQAADLAIRHQLPAAANVRDFATNGSLMSYGVAPEEYARRLAVFVDRILKGAKPADLPVEQPTQFRLVLNLKTDKALGLTLPQSLLVRTDEVTASGIKTTSSRQGEVPAWSSDCVEKSVWRP